jgi:hypothetical protein
MGLKMVTEGTEKIGEANPEAAVAEFIRRHGVTRCPTACVLPTQGSVAAADQEALEEHAARRDRLRKAKSAARIHQILGLEAIPAAPG